MPKLKANDNSERQDEDMALNAKRKRWSKCRTRGKQRLWTPNWRYSFERQDEKVALYAKQKMNNDSGCYNEHVALNTKRKMINDSECQTKKVIALISKWKCGFELQKEDVALNAKPKENVAPNAKMRMQLWTPNEKYGFERQNEDVALNTKPKEDAALNAKMKMNNNFERQTKNVALNAKMKMWLWMPKWRCGFECQTKRRCGSERQMKQNMALNAELKVSDGSKR